MRVLDDTTTRNTEPPDDELIFLNARERFDYLRGKRNIQYKKCKIALVI